MSLRDEADAMQATRRSGGVCAITRLAEADADLYDELVELLSGNYAALVISKVLAGRGHKVGVDSIQRHRRGECKCR